MGSVVDWEVSEGDQEVWFRPCRGGSSDCFLCDTVLSEDSCFLTRFDLVFLLRPPRRLADSARPPALPCLRP